MFRPRGSSHTPQTAHTLQRALNTVSLTTRMGCNLCTLQKREEHYKLLYEIAQVSEVWLMCEHHHRDKLNDSQGSDDGGRTEHLDSPQLNMSDKTEAREQTSSKCKEQQSGQVERETVATNGSSTCKKK